MSGGRAILSGARKSTRQAEAASTLLEHVSRTLEVLAPCSAAVLVSREGRLLLERYLRGPEPQNPAQAVDERSLWPWWSMTKSAAAALIARLVTEERCALDQKLSTVLPEFGEKGPGPFDRRSVTVRYVMSHTSGCAIDGREEDGTMVDARVDLSAISIISEPGTTFVYSALGMHVLERFVEALLSEDFESLLKGEVLAPFGMSDVRYIYQDDFAADPSLCARAMPSEEGRVAFSQRHQRAGTGLYSSARDILAFGERWASMTDATGVRWCLPSVRREAWKKHTLRPSDGADYGLLWWVFDDLAGYVASGASCGLCALLPSEGIVAVVARNNFGSARAPYDYNADKRKILELARAFSA